MQFYGNTTTSVSCSSQRVGDTRDSRRHNPIGPARTRLASRHNPYATTTHEQDPSGSTLKGQRRNRREGRTRPLAKRPSVIDAEAAMSTPSGAWEGASQDLPHFRLPERTPTLPLPSASARTEAQPDYTPACASTPNPPYPPSTPRLVARDLPVDEFDPYSFPEFNNNYGLNFFDSFDLGYSASHPEQIATPAMGVEEEIILPTVPRPPTPTPEPAPRSAGKISLSSLHHRMMRSKGYVPDVALDQLDGVVRQRILRHVDRLMFEYQAQSREERKWRGYREPEDDDLLKRPKKKVRFDPCSREGRNKKKRTSSSGVDELVHRIDRIQLYA